MAHASVRLKQRMLLGMEECHGRGQAGPLFFLHAIKQSVRDTMIKRLLFVALLVMAVTFGLGIAARVLAAKKTKPAAIAAVATAADDADADVDEAAAVAAAADAPDAVAAPVDAPAAVAAAAAPLVVVAADDKKQL